MFISFGAPSTRCVHLVFNDDWHTMRESICSIYRYYLFYVGLNDVTVEISVILGTIIVDVILGFAQTVRQCIISFIKFVNNECLFKRILL